MSIAVNETYWRTVNGTINLLEASQEVYTNVLGYWFFGIMFMILMVIIYAKTENLGIFSTLSVIVGMSMVGLLPAEAHSVGYVILAIAIGVILYMIYKSRR
jgi:hypothetical protein